MNTKSETRPYRLGAFVDGVGWVEYEYGRVWQREGDRLVAAPDEGHTAIIARASQELEEPFRVRYVLLVPRDDGLDEGRYEMEDRLSYEELVEFLNRYRELFENDGRHHLWIRSESGYGTVSYDQHNVLYLYGPLERFESVLRNAGLNEAVVNFPSPHSHHYHEELDPLLDDMLERYQWLWYPLDPKLDV